MYFLNPCAFLKIQKVHIIQYPLVGYRALFVNYWKYIVHKSAR